MRKALILSALLLSSFVARSQEPTAPASEQKVAVRPADPVQPFRDARLSGKSLSATGVAFEVGGGRYQLTAGTLNGVKASDGREMGWYFEGDGTLTWTPEEPNAARVYAGNADRVGGFSTKDKKDVVATFSRALLLFNAAGAPRLLGGGSGGGLSNESFQKQRARWAEDRMVSPEVQLAAAFRDERPFFSATLDASKDVRHELDGVLGGEESLVAFEKLSGMPSTFPSWRFPRRIGRRPLNRSRRAAPAVDARLVDVAVDVRETGVGWGRFVVEETWVPQRALSTLSLELRSDVLAGGAYNVYSTRMGSVTAEDGRPLAFTLEKNTLLVHFPEPVLAGAPRKLTFRYEAPYLDRVNGDNYWELELGGSWYPQPPELAAASLHTFRSVVRATKPFLAFASGDTVKRYEDGEWNVVETKLDRPVPFVTVLAGKYTLQEETQNGVTCRVASYGVSKEKSGARLTNLFFKMKEFYEPYFGPFPWKEYTLIEINDYGFGQAPPGMMRITREAFQSNIFGDPEAELFSGGVNERLAHEIAHAYWGYGVWDVQRFDAWISEAFAEMAAGRLIEVMKDKSDFKRLTNIWRARAKDSASMAPVALANELVTSQGHSVSRDRFYLLYFKGATLLQAIRQELGDDAFFTVLKSFQRSFEKKPAVTTEQFIGLLSYVTKKDWKPWFEKHYYGFETP